jgi:hypothetical protein
MLQQSGNSLDDCPDAQTAARGLAVGGKKATAIMDTVIELAGSKRVLPSSTAVVTTLSAVRLAASHQYVPMLVLIMTTKPIHAVRYRASADLLRIAVSTAESRTAIMANCQTEWSKVQASRWRLADASMSQKAFICSSL